MTTSGDNIKSLFSFQTSNLPNQGLGKSTPFLWLERLSGMDLSYRNKKSGVETTLIGN